MILLQAKRACYYIILPILPISILSNTTYFGQYYTILRILPNTTHYGRSNLQMIQGYTMHSYRLKTCCKEAVWVQCSRGVAIKLQTSFRDASFRVIR